MATRSLRTLVSAAGQAVRRNNVAARVASFHPLVNTPMNASVHFPSSVASNGSVRFMASDRAERRKKLRKQKKKGGKQAPLLKDTLRKLYLRTHPDLFAQYPEQQQQNEESYKELMGILDSIEKNNEYPPAKTQILPFYLKTPQEGEFREVSLHLRTTGGACNTLVEEALGQFFSDCGLPPSFQWGEGSWGRAVGKEEVKNSNMDFHEEESRPVQPEPEPEYTPSPPSSNEKSIETILDELNDVFEIIAAVPVMDEEEFGELRGYYVDGEGLDEIESRGFMIKEPTHRIWEGERDLSVLTKGLDSDSALIVQRILLHTQVIEQKIQEILENGGVDPDDDSNDTSKST